MTHIFLTRQIYLIYNVNYVLCSLRSPHHKITHYQYSLSSWQKSIVLPNLAFARIQKSKTAQKFQQKRVSFSILQAFLFEAKKWITVGVPILFRPHEFEFQFSVLFVKLIFPRDKVVEKRSFEGSLLPSFLKESRQICLHFCQFQKLIWEIWRFFT